MSIKKRGPVPKRKPIASGIVKSVYKHFGNYQYPGEPTRVDIDMTVTINDVAEWDDIRKAAKKAIDFEFKNLIHEDEKR